MGVLTFFKQGLGERAEAAGLRSLRWMRVSIGFGILAHRYTHLLFIILDHGDLVFINMAVVRHPVHNVEYHVGYGQVHPQPVGIVLGVENILAVNGNSGAGLIIPADQFRDLVVVKRSPAKPPRVASNVVWRSIPALAANA